MIWVQDVYGELANSMQDKDILHVMLPPILPGPSRCCFTRINERRGGSQHGRHAAEVGRNTNRERWRSGRSRGVINVISMFAYPVAVADDPWLWPDVDTLPVWELHSPHSLSYSMSTMQFLNTELAWNCVALKTLRQNLVQGGKWYEDLRNSSLWKQDVDIFLGLWSILSSARQAN